MTDVPERDDITGMQTTGHEWDGITELDSPLPRWWLYIFYGTIALSVLAWIWYPSWPVWLGEWTTTKGLGGTTTREEVAVRLEAARAEREPILERIRAMAPAEIREDPELLRFAVAGGESAFGDNCAPCHGSGAQGFPGYPSLVDDAWLWGGTLEAIQTTLMHGIRWEADPETRFSAMPAFVSDGILSESDASDVVEYVLSLSGQAEDEDAVSRGATVFETYCTACHGPDGTGMEMMGAPNLTDAIWLYGGERDTLLETVTNGRAGVMPAWSGRLDEATIRQLALYVHSLGGGVTQADTSDASAGR